MSTIASRHFGKKIEHYYYKIFFTNTNTQQIVCRTVAATQILILIGIRFVAILALLRKISNSFGVRQRGVHQSMQN